MHLLVAPPLGDLLSRHRGKHALLHELLDQASPSRCCLSQVLLFKRFSQAHYFIHTSVILIRCASAIVGNSPLRICENKYSKEGKKREREEKYTAEGKRGPWGEVATVAFGLRVLYPQHPRIILFECFSNRCAFRLICVKISGETFKATAGKTLTENGPTTPLHNTKHTDNTPKKTREDLNDQTSREWQCPLDESMEKQRMWRGIFSEYVVVNFCQKQKSPNVSRLK